MSRTADETLTAAAVDDAVTQVVATGLASFIADPERHAFLVDFLAEQGVKKVYATIAIKALAPLVAKAAKMVGGKIGVEILRMAKEGLLWIPGGNTVVANLIALAPRIDEEWGAREAAGKITAGASATISAEAFDRLPQDMRAAVKTLLELNKISEEMAAQFERLTPQLDLYLPTPGESAGGENRFYYGVQKVPFKGRVEQLEELRRFLDCYRRFAWRLVSGGGGFGKSRLALQFCLDLRDAWEVGFLKEWKDAPFFATWLPRFPTLIVVDYVVGREEKLGRALEELQRRGESGGLAHPVRVLLLERDHDGPWMKTLTGSSGARMVDAGRHDAPIVLDTLSSDDLWTVIETFAGPDGAVDRTEALDRLARIDRDRRPLYASLLGDDIAHGGRAGDKEGLLRAALNRDREKFWDTPSVPECDALALCTLCGGIEHGRTDLPGEVKKMIGDIPYDRYARTTGRPADKRFHPLEPDILGELFVLDHLTKTAPGDDRLDAVRRLAWQVDGGWAMTGFLIRATDDFPAHPSLVPLAALADVGPAQRVGWSMVSSRLIRIWVEAEEGEKAEARYAELRTLAAAHVDEPTLLEAQAVGAASILYHYVDKGNGQQAEARYAELRTLAAAHVDEPTLREAQAVGAYVLAQRFIDPQNPCGDAEKGERYRLEFERLLVHVDEFTEGPFKTECVGIIDRRRGRSGDRE